ncbi:uncharacterized protein LOC130645539 [Hydractinia symbiolongicarpus]|uniref:uncharacterized protein LOC130645539 n=1 Tax=Hydractinia symbiolongicarpus TaxID=13093 RepID=UPI00254E007E|nr:uncharacterized protein LOC130645539 [Hydractinia symbiolongicarpus]
MAEREVTYACRTNRKFAYEIKRSRMTSHPFLIFYVVMHFLTNTALAKENNSTIMSNKVLSTPEGKSFHVPSKNIVTTYSKQEFDSVQVFSSENTNVITSSKSLAYDKSLHTSLMSKNTNTKFSMKIQTSLNASTLIVKNSSSTSLTSSQVHSTTVKTRSTNLTSRLLKSSNEVLISTPLCPSVIYSGICTPALVISTVYSIRNVTSTSYITKTTKLASLPVFSTSILESSIQSSYGSSALEKTSIHVKNLSTAATVVFSSAIIIVPPIQQCDVAITRFSGAISNLTDCLLMHLHPMRPCYSCSVYYDELQNLHTLLFTKCKDVLVTDFNAQYQVIPKMFESQVQTWNALGCKKCYLQDSSDHDGARMSPLFIEFLHLYNKTMDCFANNTVMNTVNNVFHNGSKIQGKNTTKVCSNCANLYKEMQENYKYYEDSEEETGTKWCADINVSVNNTRHLWSNTYQCGTKTKDLESIIALTCFFCFLPIVFYVGAKLHSDVKERKSANRYIDSD